MQVKLLSDKVGRGPEPTAHWLWISFLARRGTERGTPRLQGAQLGNFHHKEWKLRTDDVDVQKHAAALFPPTEAVFPRSCLQRWLVAPDNLWFSTMRICFKWREGFCLMTSRPQWKAWFPHWQQGRGLPRSTLAPGIASSRTSGWTYIGSQERPWRWLKVLEMSCSNV